MNSLLDLFPQLPVADWVTEIVDWLTQNLAFLFDVLKHTGNSSMHSLTNMLLFIPPLVFIALVMAIAFYANQQKFGLATFCGLGLWYIYNQGLWQDLMFTLTLVIMASVVSIVIGIPLGIWMAKSEWANRVIQPLLDFMQTMPAFVYLIPAVAFFGIGMVPGVFASVIFALPPTVRFTNLGIRQVPEEMVEAAESFGSTPSQRLFKVELPIAKNTILAGVNQTTMLALSMVVIASMIGAPGLGANVLTALQRAEVGSGFVSGFALVILAIILDRIMQSAASDKN